MTLGSAPLTASDLPGFFLGLAAMLAAHDFYFYWIHRWMHAPALYRFFHEVHHRSFNPTPGAAFSFHPLEVLLESAVINLFLVHRRYSPLCLLKRRAFSLASVPHRLLRAHDAREVRLHGSAVGTMDGPEAIYGLVARLSKLARKAH